MCDNSREWLLIWHDEIRHLEDGPGVDERPGGNGLITLAIRTREEPSEMIERAKDVLAVVVAVPPAEWRPEVVQQSLPAWFVEKCAPERSNEAWLAWWRSLAVPDRIQAERERSWSVADWLFWLAPDERQWHWWDAVVDGERSAKVLVEVPSWPAAIGALEWLLRAAGAASVDILDL